MLIVRPEDYRLWCKTVESPRALVSIYESVGDKLAGELARAEADFVSCLVADCRFLVGDELDKALRTLRAWAQARAETVCVVALGDPSVILATKHSPWLGVSTWTPDDQNSQAAFQ